MAAGTIFWSAVPLNPPYHSYVEGTSKWVFARVTTASGASSYANSTVSGNQNTIRPQQIGLSGIYEIYSLTSWTWNAAAAVPDAFTLRWDGNKQTLIMSHFGIVDAGTSGNNELNSTENAGGVLYDVLVRGY